jgi:hypothetical protein
MFVWLMLLRVGSQVFKLKESFGNAVGRVKVNSAGSIIQLMLMPQKRELSQSMVRV